MLDHAREAVAMAAGKRRADLDNERQLSLALVRLLEIIGEAATRVPDKERERLLAIPWRQIAALRNRLIHAYDAVDLGIVWEVIKSDLPDLIAALEASGAGDKDA